MENSKKNNYKKKVFLLKTIFCFLLLNLLVQKTYSQVDSLDKKNTELYQYDIFTDSSDYQNIKLPKVKKTKEKITYRNYEKGDIDIYFSPFSIIWELSPTLYVGTEYFFSEKLSIFTNVGYIFAWGTDPRKQNGGKLEHPAHISYTIKPEIRFYKENNPQEGRYSAIKLMFRNMNYQDVEAVFEGYEFDENTQNWNGIGNRTTENFRIKRQTIGIQFIKGHKNRLFNKYTHNVYYGIGIRYVSNLFIKKPYNPIESQDENDGLFERGIFNVKEEYKMVSLDIALGLRIGGKIKRPNPSNKEGN